MKHNTMLTVASLLSILFLTLHITGDIVRGISKAESSNTALLVLAVFLGQRSWPISRFYCVPCFSKSESSEAVRHTYAKKINNSQVSPARRKIRLARPSMAPNQKTQKSVTSIRPATRIWEPLTQSIERRYGTVNNRKTQR